MKKYFFTLTTLLLFVHVSFAQETKPLPKYWNDVQTIKKYDKIYQPPANPILFIGSSSIRKWNNIEKLFAKYDALNRGIGGAQVDDITFYLKDLVFPYKPKQIVIYVGENDLVSKDVTADSVLQRTIKLIQGIRIGLPQVPIIYISLKASPSRSQVLPQVIETNKRIKNYLAKSANTTYVDVFNPMLDKNGHARPELFVKDMLHLNPKGYAIWEKVLEPYLLKNTVN